MKLVKLCILGQNIRNISVWDNIREYNQQCTFVSRDITGMEGYEHINGILCVRGGGRARGRGRSILL